MSGEKSGLNWVQVFAGAMAAVSSALLLSTLGVGGTIVGAALGSVAASVATYGYSRSLNASVAQAAALARVRSARDDLERVSTDPDADPESGLEHADVALGRAEAELQKKSRFSWRKALPIAALVFVTAMASITAFELLTGRAVSTYTGGSDRGTGSTVPGLSDGEERAPRSPAGTPSPVDPTPSAPSSSLTPSEPVPSVSPTDATPTTGSPTPSVEPEPSPSAPLPSTVPTPIPTPNG